MDSMFEMLHGIAVKKHADRAAIESLSGLANATLDALLERAVDSGRALEVQAKYMLTPAAHMILESRYAHYYAAARADQDFLAAYEQFEIINAELKQTVTEWQTMNVGGQRIANDHSDAAYDEKIIDRVSTIHERIEPLMKTFAAQTPRFLRYGEKLESALENAEEGAHEWISEVTIESYHTVWFEMHEDLLRILGRERDE